MTLSSITKSISSQTGIKADKYLKKIEFKHKQFLPNLPIKFEDFNRVIGLPSMPGCPSRVFSYQIEIDDAINKHHRIIINKSRKIGVTEMVLRSIAKNCFGRYAGFNVMIVAGNRQAQADNTLLRFYKLFHKGFTDMDGVKYQYRDIIKKSTKSELVFFNGTKVNTYPANAEALRGPERVICVFYDEAAHAHQLDDSEVYDALKPNLANTNGDFIIVSTPNGKRGIFYDLWEAGDYFKLEIPYTKALGGLLSEDFINKEKKDTKIDFEQEYNCKFTSIRNAAIIAENIVYIPRKVDDYSDILKL
jgi:hypothetical protein